MKARLALLLMAPSCCGQVAAVARIRSEAGHVGQRDDAAGDPRTGEVVDHHGTAQDVRGTKTRGHGHIALGIGTSAIVPIQL